MKNINIILAMIFSFILSGCFLKDKSGYYESDAIYYDYTEKGTTHSGSVFIYRVDKNDRSFLIEVPTNEIIKKFFHKGESIPNKGKMRINLIFDKNNKIDLFEIIEFNQVKFNIKVYAIPIN